MITFFEKLIAWGWKHLWFYRLTDGRYIHLQWILDGLRRTNVPFVEYTDGKIIPFSAVDDVGMYWLIPKISQIFNCTIDSSIKLFMYGVPVIAYISALIAFSLLYKSLSERLVAFVGLTAMLFLNLYIGDIYVAYSSIVTMVVPWAVYFYYEGSSKASSLFFGLCAGMAIGFVHYFREFSGVGPLLTVCLLFGMSRSILKKYKIGFFIAFACAMLLSNSIVWYQEYRYRQFALVNFNDGQLVKHPIWHMIYIGFGFLKFGNIENLKFQDSCSGDLLKKRRAENPKLANASNESILMAEVFRIIKEQNYFVIFTIFGKIGILLLLLLIASNFGLIAAFFYPKHIVMELSFAVGVSMTALFSIVVMPFLTYSLGSVAYGILYGIVSINHMLSSIGRSFILVPPLFRRTDAI